LAEKPASRWKRTLDVINTARAVEWIALKILLVVGLVSVTTWAVSDITSLPLVWRAVITIAMGFLATIAGLSILTITESRRRRPPVLTSNPLLPPRPVLNWPPAPLLHTLNFPFCRRLIRRSHSLFRHWSTPADEP
jgi:hypothetical protein